MSAPAAASPTSPDAGHEAEQSKFWIFVQLAMLLAVITGLELVTVYMPFMKWLLISVLVVLSTVKFMFVIFYFMHLRWDKAFCTILFFIGLVLAGGTMWALLKLFGADASIPPSSVAAAEPPAIILRVV
jgi:cytochrome c oxidase subunit 4